MTFPEVLPPDLVVRTRFVAPKLRAHILARPRVDAALARSQDHPLTIVRAEAGYGKTTAVASYLARATVPHLWYHVGDADAEPKLFLLHLIHGLATLYPGLGSRALAGLERNERTPRQLAMAVDTLSNELLDAITEDTIVVLDDYDRVNTGEVNAIIERLVETMPPLLHLVITTRSMPGLRSRTRWRASGELLEVTRADLAFTSDEVTRLFQQNRARTVSSSTALMITAETEGWPIALQMLRDSVALDRNETLDSVLQGIPGTAGLLFDYLADEVFLRQPAELRTFLSESASLRWLEPELCDYALDRSDTATLLQFLEDRSVFLTSENGLRYHNLFGDFLHRRGGTPLARRAEIHRRAAAYFRDRGQADDAVHHLLAAGEFETAAAILVHASQDMLEDGRHHTLGQWLDQLPPDVIDASAELLLARAETYRLTSRYVDALPLYARARASFHATSDRLGGLRALRGMATVYLDSVQPARAESLLREGFRVSRGDRELRAALYALLAENALNGGKTRAARRMFVAARRFAEHTAGPLTEPRLLVREGRLAEARAELESNRRTEFHATLRRRAPRSHREVSAILAWVEVLLGDSESARTHASESLEVGRALGSPVVECISLSRQGFSWLTGSDFDCARALQHFDEALRGSERLGVERFRVEPLLGQVIVHGMERRPEHALIAARNALRIAGDAGDAYMSAVVSLALGAALALCGRSSAEEWLLDATRVAAAGGDRFTETLASLWLSVHFASRGESTRARTQFAATLKVIREHRYEFLFSGRTLLGPRNSALWTSLLRRAHEDPELGDYARALSSGGDRLPVLDQRVAPTLALDPIAHAPLYVQTLGPFRMWRGGEEIERAAWPREKALHLFQLLVTTRGRAAPREQLLDLLWSNSTASTAAIGLRVALSAVRNALEPDRESGTDSHFVRRDGNTLRLASDAGIRVDADDFADLLREARRFESSDVNQSIALYESALTLYRGDFLVELPYAPWAESERQQRRRELLVNGERLARLLLQQDEPERAARWADILLEYDPVWEGAYGVLMESYWTQGNRALAVRTYDRCRKRLREGLGVAPSDTTKALLERISN